MKKSPKKRSRPLPFEYNLLLTATLCLLALGAVMVFSASSTTRILQNGGLSDSAFYLKRTLLFGAVGIVIMVLASRHGLRVVRRLTPVLLAGSIFLLLAVLAVGTEVNGATRWLGGGFLQVQPSELAKVALILYGADLLAQKPKRVRSLEGIMPFLLVVGASSLLIMLQPDMGTTMVIAFSVGATLVAAGVRPADLGKIGLVIGVLALLMAVV
jgi:cell division protein FtsW